MSPNINISTPMLGASALIGVISLIMMLISFVVFILLAIKGIQALNVYIKKNS